MEFEPEISARNNEWNKAALADADVERCFIRDTIQAGVSEEVAKLVADVLDISTMKALLDN